jgi:arginine repressor
MFDIIDEDLFADAVWEIFSVLDQRYVADLCKELLPRLQATFDAAYDTSFIILDTKTGKPVNVHAVLDSWNTAETLMTILGEDGREIGFLLRNK